MRTTSESDKRRTLGKFLKINTRKIGRINIVLME